MDNGDGFEDGPCTGLHHLDQFFWIMSIGIRFTYGGIEDSVIYKDIFCFAWNEI